MPRAFDLRSCARLGIRCQSRSVRGRFCRAPYCAVLLSIWISEAVWAELPVPSPNWVAAGAASRISDAHNLTIQQHTDRATFDWQSFNIGQEDSVRFDQPGATSVALNRIHQADPSRILGTLSANGQVYLINQNGFLFGPHSTVNTNSLIVSTLQITDETLERGLTKVIQDSVAGDPKPALIGNGQVYRQDRSGRPILGPGGKPEKIQVAIETGARISTNAAGGRILIAAPSITNRGDVSASDGQVLMAASTDRVYLQEADTKSGVRGLLVEVETGGDVNNLGRIAAARGNVTLAGFAVNQQGLVSASTSVAVNGSIRLQAREGAQIQKDGTTVTLLPRSTIRDSDRGDGLGRSAEVRLGSGSRTDVTLDDSGGTAVDEQQQPRSQVELMGHAVTLERDAWITAPSGEVSMTATDQPAAPLNGLPTTNSARIVLEPGSRIEVAGTRSTVLPMSRNVLNVELRSNELRDSPLQKNGVLDGSTVQVDSRSGTSLADISGALSRIQRAITERSTSGGTVLLQSEGDTVLLGGSRIDLSGGTVSYVGGFVETTALWSKGRLYDIATADPDRMYDGIFGDYTLFHEHWNVRESWKIPGPFSTGNFEQGYVRGFDAGELDVKTGNLVLEATVVADAIDGLLQRLPEDRAKGGRFSLDTAWTEHAAQRVVFHDSADSRTAVVNASDVASDGTPEPTPLIISREWLAASKFQNIRITTPATIDIPSTANVTLPSDGSLNLTGGDVFVAGSIAVPGGVVTLETLVPTGNPAGAGQGSIRVETGAVLDVSGRWINDQPALLTPVGVERVDTAGGTVTVTAKGDLTVAPGSVINADGGAWLQRNGEVTDGAAGTIALSVAKPGGSSMRLGGELRAYGLSRGGSLALTANQITIGSGAGSDESSHTLALDPGLFSAGGFGQYDLTANAGNLAVRPGAALALRTTNVELIDDYLRTPTGTPMRSLATPTLLRDEFRSPANLELNLVRSSDAVSSANNVAAYDPASRLTVAKGASIQADPGAAIRLTSDANLGVDGVIDAPAGNVELRVVAPDRRLEELNPQGFQRNQAIVLGPDSRITAAGSAVVVANREGLRQGDVQSGGTVKVTADRGYVLALPGSRIDVSGTSAVIDMAEAEPYRTGRVSIAETIGSAAGVLAITAAEGIVLAGDLKGQPGLWSGAYGGTLSVELNNLNRSLPTPLPRDAEAYPNGRLIIDLKARQTGGPDSAWMAGRDVPAELQGKALVSTGALNESGFSSVELKALGQRLSNRTNTGEIRVAGDVDLQVGSRIRLDAPVVSWGGGKSGASATARMSAPYVALGSTEDQQVPKAPTSGSGMLRVDAENIDLIGATSTQGFGRIELSAERDVRLIGTNPNGESNLRGEFAAGGDVGITAAQIYPTTLSDFTITVDSVAAPGGKVSLASTNLGGSTTTPLSASGRVSIHAPDIVQAGTLRAPLGEIVLDGTRSVTLADGSLTSTSARGALIPFGRTEGGLDWLYPVSGNKRLIEESPKQRVELMGKSVAFAPGATLDVSGGGDLYAYEAIPGPGGSVDRLDPQDPGFATSALDYEACYAILPSFGGQLAPYDPMESPTSGLRAGDSIYLSGGGGLSPGTYTLLPAHYALLPGAYLITPEANTLDAVPGHMPSRVDGTPVVAGYRLAPGSGETDSRWTGFAVEPGTMARTRTEYQDQFASQFFASRAIAGTSSHAATPNDAGSVAIAVGTNLTLQGTFLGRAAGDGRGSRMDIAADRLVVTPDGGASRSDVVTLSASQLNGLHVDSLLLGGTRTGAADGTQLTVSSTTLNLALNAQLTGPDVMLTAKDRITLAPGAGVRAAGTTRAQDEVLRIVADGAADSGGSADGALLRVATGSQSVLVREGQQTGKTGSIELADSAFLETNGALLLDASRHISLKGDLWMSGGSVALGAPRIGLGSAPSGTDGLVLSSERLSRLDLDELVLRSGGSVDLYGEVSLDVGRLAIEGAGLAGWGRGAQTASIRVDSFSMSNPGGADAAEATGSGRLNVVARAMEIGSGTMAMNGFGQVQLTATDALLATGSGRLRVWADLGITSGVITGAPGSELDIDVSGHAAKMSAYGTLAPAAERAEFGGKLGLTADQLSFDGRILMPSGVVSLRVVDGDLQLGRNAVIDVAAQNVFLGSQSVRADAGEIHLTADRASVRIDAGSVLALAGTKGGAEAGRLAIASPEGAFEFNGSIDAHGPVGGVFQLDTAALGEGGFSALNSELSAAGFGEEIAVRQRSGDLTVTRNDVVRARQIELSADQGDVRVAGLLDARAPEGGSVSLAAGKNVDLLSGSRVFAAATADGGDGGKVVLAAVDGGSASRVNVAAGAHVDVSGVAEGKGGTVLLRADRISGGVAARVAEGTILGAAEQRVESVRRYDFEGDHSINADDVATWQRQTAAYMCPGGDCSRVPDHPAGFTLEPGIEVRTTGQLSLDAPWDFWSADGQWRYRGGSQPDLASEGTLTLRSGGALALHASLSDGFAASDQLDQFPGVNPPMQVLQPGNSWGYRLIAGADLGAADVMATSSPVGEGRSDLTLASAVTVRTGTGDIEAAASGDIRLTDSRSAIYTTGRQAEVDPYGSLGKLSTPLQQTFFYGEYPIDGGDISLAAGGSVIGAKTPQLMSDWLVRRGLWDTNTPDQNRATAWAIAFDNLVRPGSALSQFDNVRFGFRQNVGALGGGDVTVSAGQDVRDLSVMIPTSGKAVGRIESDQIVENRIEVNGGGDLRLDAGGDIAGGVFFVDKGDAVLNAGGSVTGGSQYTAGPVFALGDARIDVHARGGIEIGAVLNPFLIKAPVYTDRIPSYFATYSPSSAVRFAAIGGDIRFNNDVGILQQEYLLFETNDRGRTTSSPILDFESEAVLRLYPGSLEAQTLYGDIELNGSINLYPSAAGKLDLLARGDILTGDSGDTVIINQSDTDPRLLPSAALPDQSLSNAINRLTLVAAGSSSSDFDASLLHAAVPVHVGDSEPVRIVSEQGSIVARDALVLATAKALDLRAGQDLNGVTLQIQNVADGDISVIRAGRDIKFETLRDESGSVIDLQQRIEVAGPGRLQLLAGRNIDLGTSDGIFSIGNSFNSALSVNGASLSLLAGIGNWTPASVTGEGRSGVAGQYAQRLDAIPNGTDTERTHALLGLLFNEVLASATAAAEAPDSEKSAAYRRGYDAIAALFPATSGAGDVRLFFSTIQTVQGGDIDLVVPGGGVNAGLARSFSGQKPASELGIVVQRAGDIDAVMAKDFAVNQSRVFTLDGGNILVWSSDGSIDAGRGAKSAISSPSPVPRIDALGNLVIDFPPTISGSGIRAQAGSPGKAFGDVILAAPRGVVDAGEAGIGGLNVTVTANAIVGAGNIQAVGTTIGIPQTVTVAVPPATAASTLVAATGVAQQFDEGLGALGSDGRQSKQPSVVVQDLRIRAELIGFGSCSVADIRSGKEGCRP